MPVNNLYPTCQSSAGEQSHQHSALKQRTQRRKSVVGSVQMAFEFDTLRLVNGCSFKRYALHKFGAQYYCECKESISQLNEQNNLVGHNHV